LLLSLIGVAAGPVSSLFGESMLLGTGLAGRLVASTDSEWRDGMLKVMYPVAVLGLCFLTGCGDKSKSSPPSGEPQTPQKQADLPTQEDLQAKLKGKKREEVIAIVGKPDREAGMEGGAGRMIYDRPIAKGSARADVWFAQGVVDNIQW
jgi:hypothetical protein